MIRKSGRGNIQFSLQTKVFSTFVVLLLFVLGCFIIYVNLIVVKPLKDTTVHEKQESAVKMSDQVDFYIDSQNQLSQRILSSKDIFAILEEGESSVSYERFQQNRRLKDIMFQAIGPSMNIKDMVIYDKQGSLFVSYLGAESNLPSLQSFMDSSSSARQWNGSGFLLIRNGDTLSFIRAINNQNGKVFGYLCIQSDQAYLQRLTEGVAQGEVYILDRENGLISGIPPSPDHADLKMKLTGEGVYVDKFQNYVAYSGSESTGWTTYLVTPKKAVLGSVNSVKYISVLLISSLMVLSFVYIYFSTRNLLLPIRKLRNQIWRINYSNLNVKVDNKPQNNELILLNEAFHDLMERLRQSIDREKIALHEEVKARNSALQAQIAPHFIHNVLYLISIAAQEGKNAVVSDMCKHLSDSLRYIVSSPYAHVTLADELEHTRHYLSLVQQNYEEDLKWEIEADELSRQVQLPRLVIQPFVENCIEHAFTNTGPPWRIKITVKQFNGLWAVEIKDNGDGFPPDKINEILIKLRQCDSGHAENQNLYSSMGNMGIVNSVNRLKLMYKNRLFFNLFNHSGGEKGATVQIIGSLTKDFY
ncbi:two-component system sensor histidine kinase YesM [Fontibacillus phaseoli]|uniref:Two-component system sensor histidine kinase YesM n=1 Tax=Fontibacillus phaseoli TaxID=1416533 RepID=A0A369BH35_9BACL|nr:sensor histidine kinase [Fontibacillus phaseoli]RCX20575.1 two-component system sensor histidine kinase YesM [Fontibacillus phaseoli]